MLLYNAVRFLLHNYEPARSFVSQYFDGYDIDTKENYSCPGLKRAIMEHGIIETAKDKQKLHFHYVDGTSHPLNDILENLLELFAARYAVINSNVTQHRYEMRPDRQEQLQVPEIFSFVVDKNGNLVTPARKAPNKKVNWRTRRRAAMSNRSALAIGEASELMKMLSDHDAVMDIFTEYLDEASIWRVGDKIKGDRLSDYLQPVIQNALQTDDKPASAKRPRSQL